MGEETTSIEPDTNTTRKTEVITVLLATEVLAHPHAWEGHGPGFFPIFPIFWALFWIALIAFFVTRRRRGWWGPGASAHTVLAERYARGEISEEEFRTRQSVLRGAKKKQ